MREVKYDQMKGFAGLSDLAVTCDYAEGHINGVMGQKPPGAEGGGARRRTPRALGRGPGGSRRLRQLKEEGQGGSSLLGWWHFKMGKIQ